MTGEQSIGEFLAEGPHAVVGASCDRAKYGNKVLRAFLQHGMPVFPVNPRETEIEGLSCYPDLLSLPQPVRNLSVVTPPSVTERIVEQAAAAGVNRIWMQPGAESPAAIRRAESLGMQVIAGGPCILLALRYREPAG